MEEGIGPAERVSTPAATPGVVATGNVDAATAPSTVAIVDGGADGDGWKPMADVSHNELSPACKTNIELEVGGGARLSIA